MNEFKFFSTKEFDCKETGKNEMSIKFLHRLDELRGNCGFPFKITSGYRSKEHSAEVHKKTPGQHVLGVAADIAVSNGTQRRKIVEEALKMGFKGIGVSSSFVHVDDRVSDIGVMWTYGKN